MGIIIRKGQPQDIEAAFGLVQELALYEKAPEEVTTTKERMLADGFGEQPLFGFFVAEKNAQIIGMSLYYFRYSTWKGKRLYLEDLIVTETMRGCGAGKMLFDATVAEAKATQCTGMMWQVLDWNEPSINFYKQYGTRFDGEWLNCHLDF
jgi:GNAT superfamily N-acetyltransferase